MTHNLSTKRQAVRYTLLTIGVEARTLCNPARTNQLAVHLMLRDNFRVSLLGKAASR